MVGRRKQADSNAGVRIAPYGSWASPIDARTAASWSATVGQGRFGEVAGRPGVWFAQRLPETGETALFWTSLTDHADPVRITPEGMDVGSALFRRAEFPGAASPGAASLGAMSRGAAFPDTAHPGARPRDAEPLDPAPFQEVAPFQDTAGAHGAWAVMPETGDLIWTDAATQHLLRLRGDDIADHIAGKRSSLPPPDRLPEAGSPSADAPGPAVPEAARPAQPESAQSARPSGSAPASFVYGDLTVSQGVLLAIRTAVRGEPIAAHQGRTDTPGPPHARDTGHAPHAPHGPAALGAGLAKAAPVPDTAGPVPGALQQSDAAGLPELVRLDPTGAHPPQVLVRSATHFAAWPRLSPDRSLLIFAGWDPPHAPWEETALFAASLSWIAAHGRDGGTVPVHARQIWRNPDTAVLQPEWVSGRSVVFAEDSRSTWRPVLLDAKAAFARASGEPGVPLVDVVPLLPDEAVREALERRAQELARRRARSPEAAPPETAPETPPPPAPDAPSGGSALPTLLGEDGTGGPLSDLGDRWLLPAGRGRRLLAEWRGGTSALLWAHPETGDVRALDCDLDWLRLQDHDHAHGLVLVTGGSGRRANGLYLCHLASGELRPLALEAEPGGLGPWVPLPRTRSLGGVPAVVHPPRSPDHSAPAGELPPFVVLAHERPADQAVPQVHPLAAHLASRGVGVAAVNTAGSSGFGRAYRDDLRGFEGVRDVADLVTAARGLAELGLADPERIAVWGARSGGTAALRALAGDDTPFACGVIRDPVLGTAGLAPRPEVPALARPSAQPEYSAPPEPSAQAEASSPGGLPGRTETGEPPASGEPPAREAPLVPVRPVALLFGEEGAAEAAPARALVSALRGSALPFSVHVLDGAQGTAGAEAEALERGRVFCAKIMGFAAAPGAGAPGTRAAGLQGRGRGAAGGSAAAH
ncbi:prolyl oligopeptidase family serine peptidase [Brevibacterium album]|uniref:prolyl oligopeptidase family serine peptidase n=1 Tax=Brevibacterium album TaxID=417948 RepID=UPI0004159B88|nr:prolyl oligopeptidase family serine peptidase [Brevibacterium album]